VPSPTMHVPTVQLLPTQIDNAPPLPPTQVNNAPRAFDAQHSHRIKNSPPAQASHHELASNGGNASNSLVSAGFAFGTVWHTTTTEHLLLVTAKTLVPVTTAPGCQPSRLAAVVPKSTPP